jgi:hypothetical protein
MRNMKGRGIEVKFVSSNNQVLVSEVDMDEMWLFVSGKSFSADLGGGSLVTIRVSFSVLFWCKRTQAS